ncbi:nitrate [Chlorella sorokiniana]|uniref:Nitrate n=1 Tax=Chlorella sorokiniana TaxID=3076 RepID=A0A2P6TH43_CHLSO|nr:nitrate [Chlorella sorokiniana]|eukprot:PRW33612.1 nitrate [Chlorella sorokiniana]
MRTCLLLLVALCALGVQGRALTQAPAPAPSPAEAEGPVSSSGAPLFTLAEVATHNSPDSAWIVVENNVYDVTEFAPTHPGGAGRIYSIAGTDATQKFMRQHGKPSMQWDLLQNYIIGELSTTS